ncbi:hypothetical protein I79_022541 [Cricetulus griseus]|uniref:Uncharacterized protein n=1 Tax=Cricetulus griseus TaxID=10029 RepID=G3IFL8_CRIGR|nr:hypothetical protein I79_022541 [Cricetulus griseus]
MSLSCLITSCLRPAISLPFSSSQVLRLKVCASTAWPLWLTSDQHTDLQASCTY